MNRGRACAPTRARAGCRLFLTWAALMLCAAWPDRAGASPAGWEGLQDAGVQIRFREPSRAAAQALLPDLVTELHDVAARLGGPGGGVTVYLAGSESAFRSLSGGRLPHWGVGFAFPQEGVILLRRFPGRQDELLRTARHELAHIVLYRRVGDRVPVWFNEGVAMWVAREWRLSDSAGLFSAVLTGGLVPLADIDGVLGFGSPKAELAYTESLLALIYLISKGGPDAVRELVDRVASGASFGDALQQVTGLTPAGFEAGWTERARHRFGLPGVLTSPQALWLYVVGLLVLAFVAVRLRNRARTRAWEAEDDLSALPPRLRLQVRQREDRL